MDDILSQGGNDDGPSRWPRRLAVTGAPVLVAVASLVCLGLVHHAYSPAAAQPPSAASAVPVSGSPAEPGPPSGSDGIDGPTLPWTGSLRLPVAGPQPAWFSPATGRAEPIGGLPDDSAGYQLTRVDGGWVVQASPAGTTACGACGQPSLPVWFLADGSRSVTRVGTANLVTPAAAGAVWLTSEPSAAAAPVTAQEVSLAGVPLGSPVRLPRGYLIDQATYRGLLLAPVSGQPGTTADELWNPADPRTVRMFDDVVAASPAEIAWTPPCAATCQVKLLDLVTGKTTAVELPAGNSATSGAFSPDENFLALEVSSGDGALATRLEVASVISGRLTAVPSTLVGSNAHVEFGWPASGDNLVAEFIFATQVQLAFWHPGAARLAVAVIRSAQELASVVVG